MELSLLLGEQIISLFLMGMMGYIVIKCGILKAKDSRVLSVLVVYVFAPCSILNSFQIAYTSDKISGLVIVFIIAFVVHFFFILFVKLLSKVWKLNAIEKASIIYTNCGYLLMPLVAGVMGEEWLLYVAIYSTVFNMLVWTHGTSLIRNKTTLQWKQIIINPNIIASAVGVLIFLMQFKFPAVISNVTAGVGRMVGPASIMVIGMLIGNIDLKKAFKNKKIYAICFVRLIILPLIVIGFYKMFGTVGIHPQGKDIIRITLLAASAPVATAVAQIAQIYHEDAEYASLINAVSVILCIMTMPLTILVYELLL